MNAKHLHRTLAQVTERLAVELAEPREAAPDWSPWQWQVARAVAALHGVSPLLATALPWNGPSDWAQFLNSQRAHTQVRHQRTEQLLGELDERLQMCGVPMVALKGAALHAIGLYRAGERPMADIDLLVHPSQRRDATHALESLGFSEIYANWKHRVFAPLLRTVHASLGEHSCNYLKIELHERIAEVLPLRLIDLTDLVYPQTPRGGMNAYPSLGSLMSHLLVHAAGAMTGRAVRLIHLHDIALLSRRMSACDWQPLLSLQESGRVPWWAYPPLRLTYRYFPSSIPSWLLQQLRVSCPPAVRRQADRRPLAQASLSYLWIDAFPALRWPRTASERFQYVLDRVRPGRETLRLRKVMAGTQSAACETSWSGLSQTQRLMRWLVARQPRADTMHAVRMAMDS